VAILAADGFEQDELLSPLAALKEAHADVKVVSPTQNKIIKGWSHMDWGKTETVDLPLNEAKPENFDALVLSGGVINPDHFLFCRWIGRG
jgi:protease I